MKRHVLLHSAATHEMCRGVPWREDFLASAPAFSFLFPVTRPLIPLQLNRRVSFGI